MGSTVFSLVLFVAQIAAGVYCIMDMNKYPESTIEAAGQKKQTVLIILIASTACCWIGLLYYWFGLKPKFEQVSGGTAGGYAA